MKTLKTLSIFVFSIFLLSLASAVSVSGEWTDGSQSLVIDEGESASFIAEAFSVYSTATVNIMVENSQATEIHSFESNRQVSKGTLFSEQYTLTEEIYQNPGTYTIIIQASDNIPSSKYIELYLTVNEIVIIEEDTNPPTVEITNPQDGQTYTSHQNTLTYTAVDAEGNLQACRYIDGEGFSTAWTTCSGTFSISTVEGANTFTVYARDSFGNIDSDEITFTVDTSTGGNDTEAPVITLLGSNPQVINLGESYTELGATATDNIDGNLTGEIVIDSSAVDVNNVGIYTVTYNVIDAAGNEADEVTRTVSVVDPNDMTAPVITVITPQDNEEYDDEDLIFEVEVNEVSEVTFSLNNGESVTMNFAGSSNGILTFTYEALNLDEGNHEVTFYATDSAGNTASETVEFSIDTTDSSKKDKDKSTSNYVNQFGTTSEEQAYLNQFKQKDVIYLGSESSTIQKEGWFQRFVDWLVNLFN